MDYTKFVKRFQGIDSARLAMWAVLLGVVLVAGMAVFNSGLS